MTQVVVQFLSEPAAQPYSHRRHDTPEGARAALSVHSLRCRHSLADSEDPLAEEPMVDVPVRTA